MFSLLVAASLVVGLALLVSVATTASKLWKAIALRHPEVWEKLGRPALGPMTAGRSRELRAFVKEGRYADLNDPEIDALAKRLDRLNGVVTVVFWVALLAALASFLTARSV